MTPIRVQQASLARLPQLLTMPAALVSLLTPTHGNALGIYLDKSQSEIVVGSLFSLSNATRKCKEEGVRNLPKEMATYTLVGLVKGKLCQPG